MGLAILILALAVAAGALAGGRLQGLARLRLRDGIWLVVALSIQMLGSLLTGTTGRIYVLGLLLSTPFAGWFVYRNLHLPGIPLAGLGLLLNSLVVAGNGAMPVSEHAAARAGLSPSELALVNDPRHEPMGSGTRMAVLGDVVPVPLPMRREVVSPGDVLLSAGVGLFVVSGMMTAARPRRRIEYVP